VKTESAEFQEIFGSSSVEESLGPSTHQKSEVQLPLLDDPLWFDQITDGRSAEEVTDADFIKTISGCDPVTVSVRVDPVTEFAKRTTARIQEIEKQSPRRRKEIRAMLRKFVDRLPGRRTERFDSDFERLAESALRFITRAVLAEA
jgi:hypothetical protein